MSATTTNALVRRLYEDAVEDISAADFVDHRADAPGKLHAREELRHFMGVYLRAFPDANLTVEDQLVDRDTVVIRWHGNDAQDHLEPSTAGYSEALTGREQQVLQLLIQGITTTHELAASLVVSDNTVKFHLRNILDKLHLHNRTEVVAHASRYRRSQLSPPSRERGTARLASDRRVARDPSVW